MDQSAILAAAYTGSFNTEQFEPYFEGDQRLGDICWIRREFEDDKPKLLVGIMRASAEQLPEAFEYTWETHETIVVIEGKVEVAIVDGPTVVLNPGDVGSFRKGGKAVFRGTAPYKQFFVMHE